MELNVNTGYVIVEELLPFRPRLSRNAQRYRRHKETRTSFLFLLWYFLTMFAHLRLCFFPPDFNSICIDYDYKAEIYIC